MKKTAFLVTLFSLFIGGVLIADAKISKMITEEYIAEKEVPEKLFYSLDDVSGVKEETKFVDPREKYPFLCTDRKGDVTCIKK